MDNRISIKRQISYLVVIIAFFTLIITGFNMISLSRTQIATMEKNLAQLDTQTLGTFEKGYENIQNIAISVAYNQIVSQYLESTENEAKFKSYSAVEKLLKNMKNLNTSIIDIAVLGENGNRINLNGDISSYEKIYCMAQEKDSIAVFDLTHFVIRNHVYHYQTLSVPIYQLSGSKQRFWGLLFATIDPHTFLSGVEEEGQFDLQKVVLLNREGSLLLGDESLWSVLSGYQENTESEIRFEYNKETYIGYKNRVRIMDGTLYTLLNYSAYSGHLRSALLNQSAVIILAFAAAAFILIFFFNRMSKSLNQLTRLMHRISIGKRSALYERIEVIPDIFQAREIYEITTAFNLMMDETNRLNHDIVEKQSRMYELELITRETEIAFLRSQINPHFLYNTLTLICGMAAEGMGDGIIQVAGALSQIYRYSIKGGGTVTVQQELAIVKSYVLIQMLRFEDRFSVSYRVDEQILNAKMPKMILQPLVENAVTHGLEKNMEHGSMEIGAERTPEGKLHLWVRDTGIGMEPEQLDGLRQKLREATNGCSIRQSENGSVPAEHGVGLYNVNSRLFLQYGSETYRLNIQSKPGSGTCISIQIPLQ